MRFKRHDALGLALVGNLKVLAGQVAYTFNLGGERTPAQSAPVQLGTAYNNRRVVLSAGKFTILDSFDRNAFGIDPQQGLVSLSFMTYGAVLPPTLEAIPEAP